MNSLKQEDKVFHKNSIRSIAYDLLKQKGKPMHYRDLADLIMKRRKIEGKTPYRTVGSRLSTGKMFKRIDTGIYGLSEWNK